MIDLIRSEWIKFRSVRSTVVLLVAAAALVIVFAVIAANNQQGQEDLCRREAPSQSGSGTLVDEQPCANVANDPSYVPVPDHLSDVTVGVPVAIFLFGTLGVQIIGQEYRFNTIRPTFTAAPWRLRVLAAKLVVVGLASAAASAVMMAICALIGKVMLDSFAIDGIDQRIIWATLLFAVGWTMYGMGLGAILRQPVAAIVIIVIQGLIAEPLLAAQVHALGPWMPFSNGIQMTQRDGGDPQIYRSVVAGGVYFFAVAIAIWAIGAFLANKRDA